MSLSIDYCSGLYENNTPLDTFLLDFGIHVIDLAQFLFGDVASVCAFTRDQRAYGVALRFVNGAVGTLEWREPPTYISQGDSGYETGHLAEIEDFVAALVEKRTTSRSAIYDSYKSVVLHDAIRLSAETGQIVVPMYEQL